MVGTRDEVVGATIVITSRDLGTDPHQLALIELLASRVAARSSAFTPNATCNVVQEQVQAIHRVEAIGTLASHITHGFNNLLTIVIGYGAALQERTPSQEVSEPLAAAKRASTLTRQLLAFGRRQVMQVRRVDVNKVVMQVQAMLTGTMGAQIACRRRSSRDCRRSKLTRASWSPCSSTSRSTHATRCQTAVLCTTTRRPSM